VAHLTLPSVAHTLAAQLPLSAAVQAPAPLQTDAVDTFPFAQVAGVQTVELPAYLHALPLLPSQAPIHGPLPAQSVRWPLGTPLATTEHFPTLPNSWHDSHCPLQLLSQHTPSTQCAELHCPLDEQGALSSRAILAPPVSPGLPAPSSFDCPPIPADPASVVTPSRPPTPAAPPSPAVVKLPASASVFTPASPASEAGLARKSRGLDVQPCAIAQIASAKGIHAGRNRRATEFELPTARVRRIGLMPNNLRA